MFICVNAWWGREWGACWGDCVSWSIHQCLPDSPETGPLTGTGESWQSAGPSDPLVPLFKALDCEHRHSHSHRHDCVFLFGFHVCTGAITH